jgi:hypothetical protein
MHRSINQLRSCYTNFRTTPKTTCKLLKKIAKIFPDGIIPADQDVRCDQLEAWKERQQSKADAFLDDVDKAFYGRDESLAELAIAYIRKHREDFA